MILFKLIPFLGGILSHRLEFPEALLPIEGYKRVSPKGANFVIHLKCLGEAIVCMKVEDGLFALAQILDNAILLQEPIIIKANFHSFCTIDNKCSTSSLATGGATVLRFVNSIFYNNAQIKQLSIERRKEFRLDRNQGDIVLDFNSDNKFYFPLDYRRKQEYDQNNFIEIAVHEVCHGLGISGGLGATSGLGVFTPKLSDNSTYVNEVPSYIFSPGLFDSFLQLKSGDSVIGMVQKANQMGPFQKNHLKPSDKNYSEIRQVFLPLNRSITVKGGLYFKTLRGDKIMLETSLDPYKPGSSVSHFDYETYRETKDHFMVHQSPSGFTISEKFDPDWKTSPLGPKTLAILETLGFKINPNPDIKKTDGYFLKMYRH